MVIHTDCPLTKSKYNSFVGVTVKNSRGKQYEKYRCRGCYMSISNEEMRMRIAEIASSVRLTETGKKALNDALDETFDLEAGDIESLKAKLYSQRANAQKEAEKLVDVYYLEPEGPMRDHLRKRHDEMVNKVKGYDAELEKLSTVETASYSLFAKFALDFINDLAHRILELTPSEMRLCKQLLFPSGFYLSDDRNVYTHHFSPIYRWAETKNDSFESENSLMVRVKRL